MAKLSFPFALYACRGNVVLYVAVGLLCKMTGTFSSLVSFFMNCICDNVVFLDY